MSERSWRLVYAFAMLLIAACQLSTMIVYWR